MSEIVRTKFAALAEEIAAATGTPQTPEQVAQGFLRIAVANMANAIKQVSVQKGHDVTRFALQCFGGAGGQHACMVADALGMETVFIHPFAGVLSAYGMGLADQAVLREQAVEIALNEAGLAEVEAGACHVWRNGRPKNSRDKGLIARISSRADPSICAMPAPRRRWRFHSVRWTM